MTDMICASCGYKQPAPTVCCGPGVAGKDLKKLYCLAGENHGSIDFPQHCGQPMKVVNNQDSPKSKVAPGGG